MVCDDYDDAFEKDLQVTMVMHGVDQPYVVLAQEALLISKLEMEQKEQILVAEVQSYTQWTKL